MGREEDDSKPSATDKKKKAKKKKSPPPPPESNLSSANAGVATIPAAAAAATKNSNKKPKATAKQKAKPSSSSIVARNETSLDSIHNNRNNSSNSNTNNNNHSTRNNSSVGRGASPPILAAASLPSQPRVVSNNSGPPRSPQPSPGARWVPVRVNWRMQQPAPQQTSQQQVVEVGEERHPQDAELGSAPFASVQLAPQQEQEQQQGVSNQQAEPEQEEETEESKQFQMLVLVAVCLIVALIVVVIVALVGKNNDKNTTAIIPPEPISTVNPAPIDVLRPTSSPTITSGILLPPPPTTTSPPLPAFQLRTGNLRCGTIAMRHIDYRGFRNTTRTGRVCQRWDAQEPHSHSRTPFWFPGRGLEGDNNNYCRNPDESPGAWCYTTDPNMRVDYCNIPECNYCGTNFQNAAQSCALACWVDSECPAGQTCFAGTPCTRVPPVPPQLELYCGRSQPDAQERCRRPCSSGFSNDCAFRDECFMNTGCVAGGQVSYCGIDLQHASSTCEIECSDSTQCPRGQSCFTETSCGMDQP